MYSIYSKVLEKSKIASVSDLRIMEAYFKGLKIDYTVVYPSGNEMQVKFVAKPKSVLIQIQDTRADIDRLIKQSDYLEADTKTANADKRVLRQHYANTKAALKTKLLFEGDEGERVLFCLAKWK